MRVLDLFCGAGGSSLGFTQEGFEVVLAIDNDPRVRETFEANHPDTKFLLEDISTLETQKFLKEYGPFDVIIGSPPCTNASSINPKKNREDTHLVEKFFDFVNGIQPEWWLMENVYETGPYIQRFAPSIRLRTLNAANFGVPQLRKRLFFGNFPDPLPTHHSDTGQTQLNGNILEPWNTLGSILEPDVTWGILSSKVKERLGRTKSRPGYSVVYPDPLHKPARTVLASAHKMHQNTFVIEDNNRYRLLTIREHSRLQGFPDDHLWIGSYTDAIHMIGNAVPPPVSSAIARAIIEANSGIISIPEVNSNASEEGSVNG